MMVDTTTSITWPTICWLASQGVSHATLRNMAPLRTVIGYRDAEGWFQETDDGHLFIAFYEDSADDVVFWSPSTDELATLHGRAFALGEGNIHASATYQFDNNLHVYADAISWLQDGGRGIVVIDWSRAFDRLRDAPRVAVAEPLLSTYRDAMKPQHMPELSVIAPAMRIAA